MYVSVTVAESVGNVNVSVAVRVAVSDIVGSVNVSVDVDVVVGVESGGFERESVCADA